MRGGSRGSAIRKFLDHLETVPGLETTIDTSSRSGMSISYKRNPDTSAEPDVRVGVYGKMWSWDFNYLDEGVWESGVQAINDGEPGVEETLPTLYLPVGERVEFTLNSRDVIHSFWVPAFLFKMDVIPGRTNVFQVVPEREGVYQGKCAELCGEYHSDMLFNVAVVSREEFDAHMDELRALGQTGELGSELDRSMSAEEAMG